MFKQQFSIFSLSLLFTIFACCNNNELEDFVVYTTLGAVRGILKTIKKLNEPLDIKMKDYITYKRIPYAEPPTGKNRFQPPVEKIPWGSQINTTDEYGPGCWCKEELLKTRRPLSEDCLFLNIFRPAARETFKKKLCTIFLIPGGGFHEGHAHDIFYNPEPFMECEKLIFVSINYRVGVLGFTNHDTKEISGNMGLKDMVMALKWVHTHIDRFGGDPDCITVFGVSSGGGAAHLLSLKEEVRAMSRRFICMGGVGLHHSIFSFAPNHYKIMMEFAKKIGRERDAKKDMLKFLQSVPLENFTNYFDQPSLLTNTVETLWSPVVEKQKTNTSFMTESPRKLIGMKKPNIEILFGYANAESLSFVKNTFDENSSEWLQIANSHHLKLPIPGHNIWLDMPKYRDLGKEIYKFYFGAEQIDETKFDQYIQLLSDMNYVHHIKETMLLHAEHGKVYSYQFGLVGKLNFIKNFTKDKDRMKKAGHSEEMCYCFKCGILEEKGLYENIDLSPIGKPRKLFREFIESFALYGVPEIEKVPMEKFTESNQYRAEFYNEYVGGKNAKEDRPMIFGFTFTKKP